MSLHCEQVTQHLSLIDISAHVIMHWQDAFHLFLNFHAVSRYWVCYLRSYKNFPVVGERDRMYCQNDYAQLVFSWSGALDVNVFISCDLSRRYNGNLETFNEREHSSSCGIGYYHVRYARNFRCIEGHDEDQCDRTGVEQQTEMNTRSPDQSRIARATAS